MTHPNSYTSSLTPVSTSWENPGSDLKSSLHLDKNKVCNYLRLVQERNYLRRSCRVRENKHLQEDFHET